MKTISLIMFILLIFSCGGVTSTNNNGIIIEIKSKFQNYKNKEIIIYNNLSESAIEEFKNNHFVPYENIESFSNEIKCKDINPNYIQAKETNFYSYNDFIACYYFDMSKTAYKGNKTYIITVGNLYQYVSGDRPPNFNSNFEALFSKPKIRIKLPSVFKDKYDISEIEKNNNYVIIYRNANDKVLLDVLKPKKNIFIYKLPKNETITCEKLGFSYEEGSDDSLWRKYRIENNEKKLCLDYPMLKSYSNGRYYGSDTYISVKRYYE